MRNVCKVVIKDGHQFIVMPSGERIPKQIWTRVYDGINPEEAYAIIKVKVDLSDTTDSIPKIQHNEARGTKNRELY